MKLIELFFPGYVEKKKHAREVAEAVKEFKELLNRLGIDYEHRKANRTFMFTTEGKIISITEEMVWGDKPCVFMTCLEILIHHGVTNGD